MRNESDTQIDLDSHIEFLRSDRLEEYEQRKDEIFAKQARFLNGKQFEPISYASWPRSGNTFLRKYFENITGIATGSDQFMKFTLNMALQFQGFKGEGIYKDMCWINKTHFP